MAAMEKGWWMQDLKPSGIAEVKEFGYPSGDSEMQAMLRGDLDIAYVGSAPVIIAIDKGLDAKIIAAVNIQGSDLMLRPGLKFIGARSLLGLNIATFPPGSIQDLVIRKWLKDNGITFSQVKILPMGPGDAITAMYDAKIDGAFLPNPSPAIISLEGIGDYAIASGRMWPSHACCCIVASGKLIRENPEMVKQILTAHIRATNYINEHPDKAALIYANRTGQDLEEIEYSIRNWDGRWISDPNLEVSSVLEFSAMDYELNYTHKVLTRDDIFDTSIYNDSAEQYSTTGKSGQYRLGTA
jgi:NitT/TauT family transport system substrate-binding protein